MQLESIIQFLSSASEMLQSLLEPACRFAIGVAEVATSAVQGALRWVVENDQTVREVVAGARDFAVLVAEVRDEYESGRCLYRQCHIALVQEDEESLKRFASYWAKEKLKRQLSPDIGDSESEYHRFKVLLWTHHQRLWFELRPLDWLWKQIDREIETPRRTKRRRQKLLLNTELFELLGFASIPHCQEQEVGVVRVLERIYAEDHELFAFVCARFQGIEGRLEFERHLGWDRALYRKVYKRFYRFRESLNRWIEFGWQGLPAHPVVG